MGRCKAEQLAAWAFIAFCALALVARISSANQLKTDGLILTDGLIGMAGFSASGASCTDGVDCLCDTIVTSNTLLACEDFEFVNYYEDGEGDWSDGELLGAFWDRGGDSEWTNTHGFGSSGLFVWADGVPTLGSRCEFGTGSPGGFSGCTGNKEWCSAAQGALTPAGGADCWGPGSNTGARIDIQRDGDVDAEVAGLTLTGGTGVGEIMGGRQHYAARVPPGNTGSLHGSLYLKSGGGGVPPEDNRFTNIGLTMKLAYSTNVVPVDGSVIGTDGSPAPWKHDEWGNGSSGAAIEHWNLGNVGCGTVSGEFPYRTLIFTNSTAAACNSAMSGVMQVGSFQCVGDGAGPDSDALYLCSTSEYDRATDFPPGTVACHQAHISGMGTTDVEIKIWHNGTLVIHADGLDSAIMINKSYASMSFNNYANVNAGQGGTPTSEAMYRYEDDIVVVNGPPEPCSAIGM